MGTTGSTLQCKVFRRWSVVVRMAEGTSGSVGTWFQFNNKSRWGRHQGKALASRRSLVGDGPWESSGIKTRQACSELTSKRSSDTGILKDLSQCPLCNPEVIPCPPRAFLEIYGKMFLALQRFVAFKFLFLNYFIHLPFKHRKAEWKGLGKNWNNANVFTSRCF